MCLVSQQFRLGTRRLREANRISNDGFGLNATPTERLQKCRPDEAANREKLSVKICINKIRNNTINLALVKILGFNNISI